MGYLHNDYGYVPVLRACGCSERFSLPIMMPVTETNEEGFLVPVGWYVVCDNCHRATRVCDTDEHAEFRWNNEFVL